MYRIATVFELASVCPPPQGLSGAPDIEHKLPCCPNPLCRHGDELEHERLYSAGDFKVESLYVEPLHDGLVKITYDCSKKKEHRVFRHE